MMEQTKQTSALQILWIGAKLLLISAIVAGIVSFVYAVTLQKYEDNLQQTKNAAMSTIFGKEDLTAKEDGEVTAVYEGEALIGYCVESTSPGFGGDIGIMVGYTADGKIIGVSIVSLSETPGLGSKINDAAYLSGYEGKGGELSLGEDIDAITGATVSSRALLAGVNKANQTMSAYLAGKGA